MEHERMEITKIVYLGPQRSKSVAGLGEFIKGEPREVPPHKAKSILSHWPGVFVAVLPQSGEADQDVEQLRADHEQACQTIAAMHAAAVGEITGPKVGIVEDVAAVRAELEQLREDFERVQVQLAGCSVAALGYNSGEDACKEGDYGWSASLGDVMKLYNEVVTLRARVAELTTDKGKEDGQPASDPTLPTTPEHRQRSARRSEKE